MKRRDFIKAAACGAAVTSTAACAQGTATSQQQAEFNAPLQITQPPYSVPPELQAQPGVPRGQVFSFNMSNSRYFPGASRTISVYIPAQYQANHAACVMVMLDNLMVSPTICDNLIHQNEMPITICIGLQSGTVGALSPQLSARINRSFEFDSITSELAEFILEELLPAVQQHKTPGGLPIKLSTNPDDRAITGGSTGAIGAFNVAWRRPDAFHRVFAWSTTMVGMRGADQYVTLVRKTEPKPLRVFVLDGFRDEWWGGPQFGDWWLANLALQRALSYAGYEVNHVWGDWGHCDAPSINFFPQAVRWLWKDWPKPIMSGAPGNSVIADIVLSDEGWRTLYNPARTGAPGLGHTFAEFAGIASDAQGALYLLSPANGVVYRMNEDGSRSEFTKAHSSSCCMTFGHDGQLYVSEPGLHRVIAVDNNGKLRVVAHDMDVCGLAASANGVYAVEESAPSEKETRIWLLAAGVAPRLVLQSSTPLERASVTWDGAWLFVSERDSHKAWSFRISDGGILTDGEPFYWFHQPDEAGGSGISQVCFDRAGWGYASTKIGLQVFSTAGGEGGLVWAILPVSQANLTGVCFGGTNRQTLYVSTENEVFARKMRAIGA